MTIRWFLRRDADGSIAYLARIREEAGEVFPEVWSGTEWVHAHAVVTFLVDPLAADEVDEATAAAFVAERSG